MVIAVAKVDATRCKVVCIVGTELRLALHKTANALIEPSRERSVQNCRRWAVRLTVTDNF